MNYKLNKLTFNYLFFYFTIRALKFPQGQDSWIAELQSMVDFVISSPPLPGEARFLKWGACPPLSRLGGLTPLAPHVARLSITTIYNQHIRDAEILERGRGTVGYLGGSVGDWFLINNLWTRNMEVYGRIVYMLRKVSIFFHKRFFMGDTMLPRGGAQQLFWHPNTNCFDNTNVLVRLCIVYNIGDI